MCERPHADVVVERVFMWCCGQFFAETEGSGGLQRSAPNHPQNTERV